MRSRYSNICYAYRCSDFPTPGLDFKEAWKRRKTAEYQGQNFYIVSLEYLLVSKRAAGRDIDLEDVRLLELPDENETKA